MTIGVRTRITISLGVRRMADAEGIRLEPSAVAGIPGPVRVLRHPSYQQQRLDGTLHRATHIAWGTGGSMVPPNEMDEYYRRGKQAMRKDSP